MNSLIQKLKSEQLLPAIVFVFSKKQVDLYEYIESFLPTSCQSSLPAIR